MHSFIKQMHLNEFIKYTSIHSLNKSNSIHSLANTAQYFHWLNKYISMHLLNKYISIHLLNKYIQTSVQSSDFIYSDAEYSYRGKNENLIVIFLRWVHFKLVAVDVTKFIAYIILSLWCHCYPCCFAFINFCMKKLRYFKWCEKKIFLNC